MTAPILTVWQVKEARAAARKGERLDKIAKRFGVGYGVIHMAVRGRTWRSITNPPPLPKIERYKKDRVCLNCGEVGYEGGTTTRCRPCYSHWRKHGIERDPDQIHRHIRTRLSREQVLALYEKYKTAPNLESVVKDLPFSAETMARRFRELGLPLRLPAGPKQVLTPGLVKWARERHYKDGIPVCDLVKEMEISYQTLYSAIRGHTWRAAGGPLPETNKEKRPCTRCGMLTGHESGLCRYCRRGGDRRGK